MFDRIGRIDDETPFIVEWFVKTAGIEVWSVQEGEQRFESHVDKLMNYIRFWQASGESEKTSIWVKTRIQQLKLKGIYTGGALSYGYRLVPSDERNRKGQVLKRYEIDMEQYIIYRQVIELTVNNGIGSYRMARMLNEEGHKTNNGGKFDCKAINRMLRADLPKGRPQNGETSEELQRLKIISDDEITRIGEILGQRAKADDNKRHIALSTKGKILLSGNLLCAHCGGRMITTHHIDHYFRKDGSEYYHDEIKYRCYHKINKLCDCDGMTNCKDSKVDEIILQLMHQVFTNMEGVPEEEKYREILKKKRNAYWVSARKTSLNLEKNRKQLELFQMEIGKTLVGEELADEQGTIDAIIPAYRRFKSWAEEFDTADLEQKKMIACQLFERIELGRDYQLSVKMNVAYQQFCSGWSEEETIIRNNIRL